MPEYEAIQLIEKPGTYRPSKTDKPFEWFPELKKMFEHFDITHMAFKCEGQDGGADVVYAIKQKVETNE